MTLLLAFTVALCAATSWAYPSGAPEAACGTMMPEHGFSAQKTDYTPYYNITVSKLEYAPGDKIKVTIRALKDNEFKGYIMQVRKVLNDEQLVGTWSPTEGQLKCGQSAVTHSDGKKKTSVEQEWTAPDTDVGNVQVWVTIVKEKATFWSQIKGPIIVPSLKPASNDTGLPEQQTSSSTTSTNGTVPTVGSTNDTRHQEADSSTGPAAKKASTSGEVHLLASLTLILSNLLVASCFH